MIKLFETGTGVFFFVLVNCVTYDVINGIIFLQYFNGTKYLFSFCTRKYRTSGLGTEWNDNFGMVCGR